MVGLGNPGARYDATRHNVGWWLVDLLKRRWSASPFQQEDVWLRSVAERSEAGELWLIKPLTYVNRSGLAARILVERHKLDPTRDLLVVVDDASLPPGQPRFRARGSAGGHNGLESIEAALGTREYARLRIGVGGPPAGVDMADWVLSDFGAEDEETVLDALPRLAEGVETWAREGIEEAMNRFNAPLASSDEE